MHSIRESALFLLCAHVTDAHRRQRMRRALFSLCLALGFHVPLQGAESTDRFSFVAFGCMPYGKENYAAYERLLTEISRQRPAFTVHCGDTKSGSEPPTDAFLAQVRTWFDAIEGAVMYTPGDNEWTDVHRTNNGIEDPLVWLGKIRAVYFATERSLGRVPIPLVTQRRDPAYAKFVENARWSRGGVVFATVHVVGSNKTISPPCRGGGEFRERDVLTPPGCARRLPRPARLRRRAWRCSSRPSRSSPEVAIAPVAIASRGFSRRWRRRRGVRRRCLVHADEYRYRLEPMVFPSAGHSTTSRGWNIWRDRHPRRPRGGRSARRRSSSRPLIAFERAADPAATKAGAEEEKVTRPHFRGAAGAATTARRTAHNSSET